MQQPQICSPSRLSGPVVAEIACEFLAIALGATGIEAATLGQGGCSMKPSLRMYGPALAFGALLAAGAVNAQQVDTARIEAGSPNDWLTYHGTYKGYDYSALDQINSHNVGNLEVAWTHI